MVRCQAFKIFCDQDFYSTGLVACNPPDWAKEQASLKKTVEKALARLVAFAKILRTVQHCMFAICRSQECFQRGKRGINLAHEHTAIV